MRKIGTTESGDVIISIKQQDLTAIGIAIDMLGALFSGDHVDVHALAARVPDVTPKPPEAKKPAAMTRPAKAMKTVVRRGTRKATTCSKCGADRNKVEWPKAGSLCLECNRKRNLARYYALKGKKPPVQAEKPPASAPTRVPVSRSGSDRVRAALKRIEERDGLPVDPITHKTEKILTD